MAPIEPQLPPSPVRGRPPDEEQSISSENQISSTPPKDNAPPRNSDEIQLDESDSDSDSDAAIGPSADPTSRPAVGPSLPGKAETQSSKPSPPTASNSNASSDSDDDNDDFGPSLPSATAQRTITIGPSLPPAEAAPQRDSWMLAPPTAQGYTERDPTRIRNRKFASKPTSAPPSSSTAGLSSIWTETPEEKLRRLQDSVLGRAGAAGQSNTGSESGKKRRAEEERDRKIAASIEAQRGKSLYDENSKKRRKGAIKAGMEDDDPSKRAFDKEKDMALGRKIGTAQRRELVSKAANFGGRFQKGSYL